ncbi:MAG: hypothetical protein IT204_18575 [Fimbriimonadaceae bacterium]|nr:hypothetical protein [Fimbriimonadaceae bacterium]
MIILSGPSCVGKGPLLAAWRRGHPDLPFRQPVLYTTRAPRPGEREGVDWYFRSAAELTSLDRTRFFVHPMRQQWRAVDLRDLQRLLAAPGLVVLELSPLQVAAFCALPALAGVRRRCVLLQPLSPAEALALAADRPVAAAVADLMLGKQVQRALRLGQRFDLALWDDLRTRALAAWDELTAAGPWDLTLVNHDAEGSEHWLHDPPPGDAGATLAAVLALARAALASAA